MNPEFVRNLWLEATPFRLALVAGLVLLALTAGSAIPSGTSGIALILYWFFAVLWGTRSAALSVVGEIRERTWDSQKLSAIGPIEMVWGKLFGATIHNWFGAGLALAAVIATGLPEHGAAATLSYAVVLLLVGVLSQAVALLSSLVLIRRNTGNWRLDTFLCQIAGILVAAIYYSLASSLDAFASGHMRGLLWWDRGFDSVMFGQVSLVMATAWALVGCWRVMRAELRFTNGPFLWLAWLLYLFVYQAGFTSLLPARVSAETGASGLTLHLLAGGAALLASAYGMVFLEPKDPVRMRWLGEQARAGRLWRAFLGLDAWMLSYGAAMTVGVVLIVLLAATHAPLAVSVIAMLGFLTRDVAVFVLLRRFSGGKGDFAALAVLAAVYILLPTILKTPLLTELLLPLPGNLLSPLSAWAQGLGLALWARQSIAKA